MMSYSIIFFIIKQYKMVKIIKILQELPTKNCKIYIFSIFYLKFSLGAINSSAFEFSIDGNILEFLSSTFSAKSSA